MMNRKPFLYRVLVVGLALGFFILSSAASAQSAPKALRGQIITNSRDINVPTSAANFIKKMRKQDRKNFKRDESGKWVIHFVAFFNRALPGDHIGVVVLDAKKEPVAVADVAGQKGQRTLASQIIVETTETPGKKHTLQVYFARGKKPVVLAKKEIVLR
jgi:hypothetical protein